MRPWTMAMAMLLALLAGQAFAQARGDRVLVQREADGLWYPAHITSVEGTALGVAFDDGDVATVGELMVRDVDWARGTRLECNWHGAGRYYGAVIEERVGERIDVVYDNGDVETMPLGRCRSN